MATLPEGPQDRGAGVVVSEVEQTTTDPLGPFRPSTRAWFEQAFGEPTRVQREGWPVLAAGQHALLVAPTGSGKTLAAFLWALDRLSQLPDDAPRGLRVVYVSPLKALVYDIERNLRSPLVGIERAAALCGERSRPIGVDVRTGDTPQRERQRQARSPGEILVTTPESLFLLLASQAAANFETVTTVIVDEIHALAPTKRGVHLALSLERLGELAKQEPQRIGLSATVRPTAVAAAFLGGDREVSVVDASARALLDLSVVVPIADMDSPPPPQPGTVPPPRGGAILAELARREHGIEAPLVGSSANTGMGTPLRHGEVSGVWPHIYPQLLEQILAHRSTIVFTNSRGLCERVAERLNDLHAQSWRKEHPDDAEDTPPDLVQAHHGSVSHEKRALIEEGLKNGSLRAIVATSSLELGIDMGAVDLVILVESPGSVARGLQRVGRAGHSVGERSIGLVYPKFKGDLLECAVVGERMLAGEIEPLVVPRNPLDVLAQQIVAACVTKDRTVEEIGALVRRADPYRELSPEVLVAVLEMLSGRFPSDEFADLRPTLSWDRTRDVLSARRGARQLVVLNAGTIPDRGLYAVYLGEDGPRLGELDEEMVYETRAGDTFLLGATTWRVLDITRDRVVVAPAPGEPGRMPFWRGDGPGRPIELGRALGAFLGRLDGLDDAGMRELLAAETRLDPLAIDNLVSYVEEQREATGVLPSERTVVVERFRDELGDWRVCILSPFGSRVHAPWAMALERRLGEQSGFEVESMISDDGIVLRFADSEELPDVAALFPDPEELEDLIVDQVGSSALFASHFRENAARALLMPRNRPGKRNPLWLQRLRSKTLLAAVRRFANFPIVLETYRECVRDIFDVPALVELLGKVRSREVRVREVETPSASPFARSLVFAYVANYLYEQDAPLAERKAQALTLDRNLLRELLGQAELRELLDADALREVEEELQGIAPERQARSADELHDLLRRLGDLTHAEIAERSQEEDAHGAGEVGESGASRAVAEGAPAFERWLARLEDERRACLVRIAGEERWIATDDAARYRDALGVAPPSGLPDTLLQPVEGALEGLVARWARTHGPFTAPGPARRFGLLESQVAPILTLLEGRDQLVRGEIRPGGQELEWCDVAVLRRIKRRTLAKLRGEVAPVESQVLGRFLPRWHELAVSTSPSATRDRTLPSSAAGRRLGRRTGPSESQRLEEALARLEGLALPWSSLSEQILPARVPGFRAEMLDLLAAAGELVWVGRGALGARDGKVVLYRRERAAALLHKHEAPEPTSDLQHAILEHLADRGASFTIELERLPAARGLSSAELEAAIWDLVWAGAITNDTLLPLRTLAAGVRRRAPASASGLGRVRGTRSRRGGLAGGRWSLVAELREDRVSDTEWAHATATMLLERYGLVSREVALAEEVPGGFAVLYPVLRAMEDSGQVRRGYFVEGLAGRQFALGGAVERLRGERGLPSPETDDESGIEALAAVDPANPWGALLQWPERSDPEGPKARRVPGAWVLLRGGLPCAFVEVGMRGLVTFAGEGMAECTEVLGSALLELASAQRRRSVRLARIDGQPAAKTAVGEALVRAKRALVDGGGLWLERR